MKLTGPQQRVLLRVHARWSEKNPGKSVEYMLPKEIFEQKTAEQRRLVEKFERDGGETRKIRQEWNDPRSPETEVHLTPDDIDWEQLRAKSNPVQLGDGISLAFPKRALDRLERGLAYGQTWRKQYPGDAPIKLYASFEEWAQEQVTQWIDREISRMDDEEEKSEWESLYPGITGKPEAPPANRAERRHPDGPRVPVTAKPQSLPAGLTQNPDGSVSGTVTGNGGKWESPFAGRGVNPHRPHAKGPTDR